VSEVPSSQNVNSTNNFTGGGVDYNSGPYTVTFPAGVTSVPLNVPINNDNICERNENFNLTINSTSLPSDVTVGDTSSTTVAIVDDEGMYVLRNCPIVWQFFTFILYTLVCIVSFEQAAYSVNEDAGPVQLVLVLSNPSSTDVTVELLSTDGTAIGKFVTNFEQLLCLINNYELLILALISVY